MENEITLTVADGCTIEMHYTFRDSKPNVFELVVQDFALKEVGKERCALITRTEAKMLINFLQGFLDVSEEGDTV